MGRDADMLAARDEVLALRKATRVGPRIVAALVWCRLGSGHRLIRDGTLSHGDAAFHEAKNLGLLAQDPVWRTTDRGDGVLVALGLLDGEPAPSRARVHVLWAVSEHFPTNFVAAFNDGLVDCWDEAYQEWRAQAEREFADFGDSTPADWRFFTTVEDIPRPTETPEHAWEVTRDA